MTDKVELTPPAATVPEKKIETRKATARKAPVSYTHLTLPTIYSV